MLSVGRSRHPFAGLHPDRCLGCRGDGVDVDEEVAGAAQGWAGPVRWRVGDQPGLHQSAGQRGQRDLRLDPGERGL
ncbi:hypothetical protein FHR32_000813 [Streptosporangium album]|uniref:Uncharacterized protein n=1 Tax=Streptosporangium album TaxID=47479 RepID=A0A7W7W760_9ACTN|nr:hypothetical protein [Streptosporangium album]MBB4936508.1 hypothetical protein [Streptosporangium album]